MFMNTHTKPTAVIAHRVDGRRHAFSMVELLVVISVVALLMTILLPALGAGREVARQAKCGNNLRQLGIAYISYMNDNKGWTVSAADRQKSPTEAYFSYRPSHFRFWAKFTMQSSSANDDPISNPGFAHLARLWAGYFNGVSDPTLLTAEQRAAQFTSKSLEMFNCPSAVTFALNKQSQANMLNIGTNTSFNIPYYMRGVPQGAPVHSSFSVTFKNNSLLPEASKVMGPGTVLMGDMTGYKKEPGNHSNVLAALYVDGRVKRFRHPMNWTYDYTPHYIYGQDRTHGFYFPGAWTQLESGQLQNYKD